MIGYRAAIDVIAGAARALEPRSVPLDQALGAAVAGDLRSSAAVPSFANAAMDGYALRSVDTAAASAAQPVALALAGSIAAGEPPPVSTPEGAAWEIMTGAAMPAGCDAVLPVESATLRPAAGREPARVLVAEHVVAGRNRRDAGTDFEAGALLLGAGMQIGAPAVMALAAVGYDSVPVRPAPRVAVLTTGSELAATGLPGTTGVIRDANGPYLVAALAELAVPVVARGSARDEPDLVARELDSLAARCDVILTTGGVSAGRLDFVPATIARLGGEILFHKVAIRPGKPLLFARLPNGTLFFGLPGNPMGMAVGLRFFVLPALRALMGSAAEQLVPARVVEPVRKRHSLTFFAKAHAQVTQDATLNVRLLPGQESFRIRPLLEANCWAVIPDGREDVGAGEIVRVAPLRPGGFPAGAD
jgi:molybdopterin molybdotransferase